MACPFLDKLPSEIRKQIYEHVLDFDDIPLRYATQLQPFVKKLTGTNGELPFQHKNPSLAWDSCDLPLNNPPVSVDILFTSKLIYTEAIKMFYDQNVISVDIELFKLANVNSPDAPGSDVSLAKRLVVTFNQSCNPREMNSRAFNSIDPKIFTTLAQTIFPQVSHIVIHVDETHKPLASLFSIAEDCHASSAFQHVHSDQVGSFLATAPNEITLTIRFKQLADLWKHYNTISEDALVDAIFDMPNSADTLADQSIFAYMYYDMYKGREWSADSLRTLLPHWLLRNYDMLASYCPIQAKAPIDVDSPQFWTAISTRFEPYGDQRPFR